MPPAPTFNVPYTFVFVQRNMPFADRSYVLSQSQSAPVSPIQWPAHCARLLMWPTPAPSCVISLYKTACVPSLQRWCPSTTSRRNRLSHSSVAHGQLYRNVRRLLVRVKSSQHSNVLLPHDSQGKNMQNVVYRIMKFGSTDSIVEYRSISLSCP